MPETASTRSPFALWYITACATLIVVVINALVGWLANLVDGVVRSNFGHGRWSPVGRFLELQGSAERGKVNVISHDGLPTCAIQWWTGQVSILHLQREYRHRAPFAPPAPKRHSCASHRRPGFFVLSLLGQAQPRDPGCPNTTPFRTDTCGISERHSSGNAGFALTVPHSDTISHSDTLPCPGGALCYDQRIFLLRSHSRNETVS